MENIVKNLILEKKEGAWWDFKLKHHKNSADLLHDILCLSNVIYDGDRYLIFGVNDDYEIVGVNNYENRRNQSDILDFLRKKSFAHHNIPNLELHTISINDFEIDVLIIKNEKLKPYYLTKDEKYQGKCIRAGVTYSRLQDTNTPVDSSANPYEIEAMWRERFGLNDKATEKFVRILKDYENWIYDGYGRAFYDINPDYTIEIESSDEDKGGKFWWEENLHEKTSRMYYRLLFRNVEIHKMLVVNFHSECLTIPYPEIEFVTYQDKDDGLVIDCYCDLFYYVKNTLKHSLYLHIRSTETDRKPFKYSPPIETQIKPAIIHLPFPFYESEYEMKDNLNKIKDNFSGFLGHAEEQAKLQDSDNVGRYEKERLFSEWSFELTTGTRM